MGCRIVRGFLGKEPGLGKVTAVQLRVFRNSYEGIGYFEIGIGSRARNRVRVAGMPSQTVIGNIA
jgi:hypothetical protein